MALLGLIDTSTGRGIADSNLVYPPRAEVSSITGNLQTQITNKGAFTQPPNSPISLTTGAEISLVHPAITNEIYTVSVLKNIPAAGKTNATLDFDLADAGNYAQQDNTKTLFDENGFISLQPVSGSGEELITWSNATHVSTQVSTATGSHGYMATSTFPFVEWGELLGTAKVFDNKSSGGFNNNDIGEFYLGTSSTGPGSIVLDLGTQITVSKLRIYTGATGNGYISDITAIYTSTDNVNWSSSYGTATHSLSTDTNSGGIINSTIHTDITINTTCRYIKVYCETSQNGTITFNEWGVFYVPQSYPITDYWYVTTTDANNFLLEGIDSIQSPTVTQTLPTTAANIHYLISFDGRSTWNYWTGSTWATTTLGNIGTVGNNLTTHIASISGSFPEGSTSVDIAWGLSTTDPAVTPTLSQYTINYIENARYDPCIIGPYSSSTAEVGVKRLDSTKTKFKNLTNETMILYINLGTP